MARGLAVILFGRDILCEPVVVAEIGANHEGSEDKAHELIHLAARAGADAVKFQTFTGRKFALPYEAFRRLAETADADKIAFFSTPIMVEDAKAIDDLVDVWKVSSAELAHDALLSFMAETGKPVVMSTGGSSEDQIAHALDIIGGSPVVLLHCIPKYPTPLADANLARMQWLWDTFACPVGYSDHVIGLDACKIALGDGACMVEKHFTDKREGREFRDHLLSADPTMLSELVRFARVIPAALGEAAANPMQEIEDIRNKRAWREGSTS